MAAEYIMDAGNENIVLCERGIRTYENSTRNTLDLSAVPLVLSIPICRLLWIPATAPASGNWFPMTRAAVAAAPTVLWWKSIRIRPGPCVTVPSPCIRKNLLLWWSKSSLWLWWTQSLAWFNRELFSGANKKINCKFLLKGSIRL